MNAFVESLVTPGFWLSVVLVSVVLNVVSGYIKSAIDRIFSSISIRWQRRSEESRKRRKEIVNFLQSDQHAQLVCLAIANRKHIESVFFFVFAFFVFAVLQFAKLSIFILPILDDHTVEIYQSAKPFLFAFGILLVMWSIGCRDQAQGLSSFVEEANMGKMRI